MIPRTLLVLLMITVAACSKDAPPAATDTQESPAVARKGGQSKEPPPSRGGVYEATTGPLTLLLFPEAANAGSVMSLRAKGFVLPSGADGDDRVVWYVDGSPVSNYPPGELSLSEHLVNKGSTVQAEAVYQGSSIFSNPVTVRNTPPRLTYYKIQGKAGTPEGGLYAQVEAEDIDGDSITIEYQWFINGQPMGEESAPMVEPLPNDDIRVVVKAFDGEDYGQEETVLATYLNQAPRIEEVPDYYIVGNTYIYNASASDPDGENITFSLRGAPAGMSIDPVGGQVRWEVPKGFLGILEFTVIATDETGAGAMLPVTFSITEEKQQQ